MPGVPGAVPPTPVPAPGAAPKSAPTPVAGEAKPAAPTDAPAGDAKPAAPPVADVKPAAPAAPPSEAPVADAKPAAPDAPPVEAPVADAQPAAPADAPVADAQPIGPAATPGDAPPVAAKPAAPVAPPANAPAATAKPAAAPPPPPAPEPAAPPGRLVQVTGVRITAQLEDVSLDEVIALFSAATGAEVRGSPVGTRQVSADFADVPLYEGLSRLLGDQNFTLTFRTDGTVKTLKLLGGPQDAPPATQVVRNDAAAAGPSGAELMQHRVSIPPGSRLAQHLGGDSATLQQLLETTVRESDPGLRTEALRAGLGGLEADPTLREATVKALGDIDDQTLENVVRAVARDHARELVAQVSTFTKINEVRTRGFALLRQLNQPGSP